MAEIDNYILEIDMLRANHINDITDMENYIVEIDTLRHDILDYWLMLSDEERENEWNNYTDEEKEELNEKREQLLFMLYWDS
jgi:hypothetical protein